MPIHENLICFSKVLLKDKHEQFIATLDPNETVDTHAIQFQQFAEKQKLLFWIDWTGESDFGEVGGEIEMTLEQQGIKGFSWDNDAFVETVDFSKLQRGEYPPLLFKAIDRALQSIGCRLVYFMMGDDAYHFTALRNEDFEKVDRLAWEIYGVYGIDSEKDYDVSGYCDPPE